MIDIILIRHGETEEKIKGLILGQKQGKLTEIGKTQAKQLAKKLINENIDIILSSDLGRVKETVKEILLYHKIPVIYMAELRERSMGIFDGLPKGLMYEAIAKSGEEVYIYKPQNGESFKDVEERVKRFVSFLIKEYPNKSLLIAAHKAFNSVMINILLKKPLSKISEIKQDHACINKIILDENGEHKVLFTNQTGHLRE